WNTLSGGDYDNNPSSSGSLPSGNDWETSFDVTALVTGDLEKLREYGMLMKLQTEGPLNEYQNIASREFVDPQDFAPYLEIDYSEMISSSTTTSGPVSTSTTSVPVSSTSSSILSTSSTTTSIIEETTTISSSTTTARLPLCFVETIYGKDSAEVVLLRYIRDHVLQATPEGREIVHLYYGWSPFIVSMIENDTEFREELRDIMDEILYYADEAQ
ncbi:MAG: hypothetical protein LUQ36_11195, partial [Methanoregula sp.]|nr:hypothetical protein [Methanoregula sp.]